MTTFHVPAEEVRAGDLLTVWHSLRLRVRAVATYTGPDLWDGRQAYTAEFEDGHRMTLEPHIRYEVKR